MPLLYRPKFCCQCGENIVRAEWKPWNSRRFCEVCAAEYKRYDLLPLGVLAVGLAGGLIGISSLTVRPTPENARPVQLAAARPAAPGTPKNAASTETNSRSAKQAAANNQAGPSAPGQFAAVQNAAVSVSPEKIYFCGAATKKGTPCSRRVKSPGRCWQHIGQPSISTDSAFRKSK